MTENKKPTLKLYLVMRKDLKMRRGKEIAQACHAVQYMTEFMIDLKTRDDYKSKYAERVLGNYSDWVNSGHTKIAVSVDSEEHLKKVSVAAVGCVGSWAVIDEGRTEVESGTLTCVAIGPVTYQQAAELGLDKLELR